MPGLTIKISAPSSTLVFCTRPHAVSQGTAQCQPCCAFEPSHRYQPLPTLARIAKPRAPGGSWYRRRSRGMWASKLAFGADLAASLATRDKGRAIPRPPSQVDEPPSRPVIKPPGHQATESLSKLVRKCQHAPKGSVEAGAKLGAVAHDGHLVRDTFFQEQAANGSNARLHHVRWSHDVAAYNRCCQLR